MYVKSLTLRGFKSFASTTKLEFGPGIIGVVGPNGSGKSNIVDALAWVMGEQGAKSLRGSAMSDVIFAGTASRQALGRAEVQLTIDNTDGLLPIDYSEVTISRVMLRGEGSEYSINGTPARLLDVTELLSDTGMGRNMHVIVGQGQLDSVLASDPIQRRAFIDEAAGVLKHQRRKERALRKLEATEANLVRLQDLAREVHRQLGPLARAASAARKASVVQAKVRDLRLRLLADSITRVQSRLRVQLASGEQSGKLRDRMNTEIKDINTQIQKLEVAAEQEQEYRQTQRNWQELVALHERLRSVAALAEQKIATLNAPTLMEADSGTDHEELIAVASEQLETARIAHDVAKQDAEAAAENLSQAQRESERLSEEYRIGRDKLSEYRGERLRLKNVTDSAKVALETAQEQWERASQELETALARQRRLDRQLADTTKPSDTIAQAGAHSEATAALQQARTLLEAAGAAEKDAATSLSHWQATESALQLALKPADASANLVGQSGVLGMLAPLVQVAGGYAEAIGAALGDFAQSVLVESISAASRSLASADGQVNVVIADAPEAPQRGKQLDLPAGARLAHEVVTYKTPVGGTDPAAAIGRLLDGVVVCDDLSIAQRVVSKYPDLVATTKDGAYLSSWAARSGGQKTAIGLQSALDDATDEVSRAAQQLADARANLTAVNTQVQQCQEQADKALAELRAADAAAGELAREYARIEAETASAHREVERITKREEDLQKHVESSRQTLERAQQQLDTFLTIEEPKEPDETLLQKVKLRVEESREQETQARVALADAANELENARNRLAAARQRRTDSERRAQQAAEAERRRLAQREKVSRYRDISQRALAAAKQAMTRAEQDRNRADQNRAHTQRKIASLRDQLESKRVQLDQLTEAAHRDEVAATEIRMRLDALTASASRDYGLDSQQLLADFGPHNMVPVDEEHSVPYVREECERNLQTAEKQLERIGKVNPLAMEEHEALQQRFEFLTEQINDVKQSRQDLNQVIGQVDELVEEVFRSAFERTREAFHEVFDILFPDGRGDLVLTDPDNLLTTGIDIEARPAGKKVKHLSLLSGGERSLAALAYLIAIFKARPSPFYILDEVEAALDDANLSRVLTALKTLGEKSQLIIITHQKRTMEIADALYGVSMREGVSKVVSQRL